MDALTLFDQGVDLLIRQQCVDVAFFTALAREFPRRHAELAELARICGVHWMPSAARTEPPPKPHRGSLWVGLAVVVCLAGVLIWQVVLASGSEVPAEIGRVEPEPPRATFVRFIRVPDGEVQVARRTPNSPPPDIWRARAKPGEHTEPELTSPPPVVPVTPSAPATPACVIPDKLRADLQALGVRTLKTLGVSKEFTVTLPSGATTPRVSPGPGPGETAISRLHSHLKRLSPADLGNCRDRSIDVYFSADVTTVEFHK